MYWQNPEFFHKNMNVFPKTHYVFQWHGVFFSDAIHINHYLLLKHKCIPHNTSYFLDVFHGNHNVCYLVVFHINHCVSWKPEYIFQNTILNVSVFYKTQYMHCITCEVHCIKGELHQYSLWVHITRLFQKPGQCIGGHMCPI